MSTKPAHIESVKARPAASVAIRAPAAAQSGAIFSAKLKKAAAVRSERREQAAQRGCDERNAREIDAEHGIEQRIVALVRQREDDATPDQPEQFLSLNVPGESLDFPLDDFCEEVTSLSSSNGLFEILMPHGARLAVAIATSPTQIRILLSSSDATLCQQLKRRRMELEQHLARHTGRDVLVTVL